eukprot:8214244-Pyramimonas_sp.AAC.1
MSHLQERSLCRLCDSYVTPPGTVPRSLVSTPPGVRQRGRGGHPGAAAAQDLVVLTVWFLRLQVYASVDAEAVLALLQHKIVRASLEEGIAEGRLLLQRRYTAHCNRRVQKQQAGQNEREQIEHASSEAGPSSCPVARALCPVDHAPYRGDWLVILTAHYNEHYGLAEFGESAGTAQLDVAFSHCEALQSLPRLVFALLRSPLLQVS